MMLRVLFVCALVALASASISENLFADEKIGLTRGARDDCIAQGLDCVSTLTRTEASFIESINTVTTFNTGPDYVDRVCSAGDQVLQCLRNLGSCAELVMYHARPRIEWACGPQGRDVYARLNGTKCSSNPNRDTRARSCRRRLCSMNGSVECLRERWTATCNSAFAEFQIAMLYPNSC